MGVFKKIESKYNAILNKGLEHVSIEFDRRTIRLLNFICFLGISIVNPIIFIKELLSENYLSIGILFIVLLLQISVIYLNSIGKSQLSCSVLLLSITTLSYFPAFLDDNKIEVPFVVLCFGFFSIFLLKNKIWKVFIFLYSFVTFLILYYSQFSKGEYGIFSFLLIMTVLLVFAMGLHFINRMRNSNEKTILRQNEELKVKSEQLLKLERERHQQELLLKQKDMEMVLSNNQVQTQLNHNLVNKLREAQGNGELEKNVNQIILELLQQNEINNRMKLIEQNMDVVNTSFFDNLTKLHPEMTRVDKEFCSYIKMGLSSKEIAVIRNTSVNSVIVTKSRLRKKLNLSSNKDIAPYLASI